MNPVGIPIVFPGRGSPNFSWISFNVVVAVSRLSRFYRMDVIRIIFKGLFIFLLFYCDILQTPYLLIACAAWINR